MARLFCFCHGAGERGSDGHLQTTVGLGPHVKARSATFPFLVVFPQCENVKGRLLTGWTSDSPDGRRAVAVLDDVEKHFSVDKSRGDSDRVVERRIRCLEYRGGITQSLGGCRSAGRRW